MKHFLLSLLFLAALPSQSPAQELTCFELRTYFASEGKLEALHSRFRDHTIDLFKKHGITNFFYCVPLENADNRLVYLLAYPDRESRETSWKRFLEDPEWQAAKAESEKDGKLVAKVESLFLTRTDYSPGKIELEGEGPRLFEMRRYTTLPGKLPALDARFRDHTVALFAKHGMTNLLYFHLDEGQEGYGSTLLYFLSHDSAESQKASFDAFRSDPDWIAARDASEKDGKLLIDKGVVSTSLNPTDYSPVK